MRHQNDRKEISEIEKLTVEVKQIASKAGLTWSALFYQERSTPYQKSGLDSKRFKIIPKKRWT